MVIKQQSWCALCTQKMQLAHPLAKILRQLLTQNHYIKHLLAHPKSRLVAHLGAQVPSSVKQTKNRGGRGAENYVRSAVLWVLDKPNMLSCTTWGKVSKGAVESQFVRRYRSCPPLGRTKS